MPNTTTALRRVTFRLPEDLMAEIERLAKEETRPTNSQAIVLLREALHARDVLPQPSRTREKRHKR